MEHVNARNGESDFEDPELEVFLKRLTCDLIPNNRYELSLKKLKLNPKLTAELELATEITFSQEQGLDIDLSYSEESKDLHIEQIVINPESGLGTIHVLDTHSPYGYVALKQNTESVSISQSAPVIDTDLIEAIRAGLGLQFPPVSSPYAYRLWLANTIDSSDGWELVERMSLCEGITGYGNYDMNIEKRQAVEPNDISETHTFRYKVGVSDGLGATDIYAENLSVIDYMRPDSHSSLSATFTKYRQEANPFIPNHNNISLSERRPINLDEVKKSYFLKLMQLAMNEREIIDSLPND